AAGGTVDTALRRAAAGPGGVIEGGRRRTWAELDHAADEVATVLAAAGAGGGRVALRVENTFAHLGAMFGIWRAGGTLVPLSPRLTASEAASLTTRARVAAEVVLASGSVAISSRPAARAGDGRAPSGAPRARAGDDDRESHGRQRAHPDRDEAGARRAVPRRRHYRGVRTDGDHRRAHHDRWPGRAPPAGDGRPHAPGHRAGHRGCRRTHPAARNARGDRLPRSDCDARLPRRSGGHPRGTARRLAPH